MTLFTAEALINRRDFKQTQESVYNSYLNWLKTQISGLDMQSRPYQLNRIKELNVCKQPGRSCIEALRSGNIGTFERPINDSKGCGGIMRVTPFGLVRCSGNTANQTIALEAMKSSALTHGNPLGIVPQAIMAVAIHCLVYSDTSIRKAFKIATDDTRSLICSMNSPRYQEAFEYTVSLLDKAYNLSKNDRSDSENIPDIGAGWVAEETLAIAAYAGFKYSENFQRAVEAAVNHNGDSDQTGALAGSLVGAHIGYSKIPQKWKDKLEMHDLLLNCGNALYKL